MRYNLRKSLIIHPPCGKTCGPTSPVQTTVPQHLLPHMHVLVDQLVVLDAQGGRPGYERNAGYYSSGSGDAGPVVLDGGHTTMGAATATGMDVAILWSPRLREVGWPNWLAEPATVR